MRRLLSLFILVMVVTCIQAQIPDWILDMAKGDTTKIMPSVQNEEVKPVNNIVCEAIIPTLTIIRQQYRLELNGEHYGKNNLPYYGETFSLGVKVAGGMLFLKDVFKPWLYDSDYNLVNASGKYKVEYYATYQRALRDSVYTPIDLELSKQNYSYPVNIDSTLYKHVDARSNFGLNIDETAGLKDGYMLWVHSRTNVKDSAMDVDISQSSYSINASAETSVIAMAPNEPNKLIGGLYVVPKFEQGGRVQFIVAGVAVKSDESEWKLQLLVNDLKTVNSSKTQKPKQDTGNVGDAEPTPVKTKKK